MKKLGNILIILLILVLVVIASQIEQPIVAKGAELVKAGDSFSFTEGPAADRSGSVYFTDQPNNRIMKWCTDGTISTFMDSCGRSNGMYFNNEGKLLTCADEHNELWAIDTKTKDVEVVIADFEGLKLNGPNDLWVTPDGGIYFTDPYYKRPWWSDPTPEIEKKNLYYRSPEGELKIVDDNLVQPNGLIGTPDGNTLYVSDINDKKTYEYHILADGNLSNRKLFCEMGSDGMTIDYKGNIYLTNDGVHVFNRKGEEIEHIEVDENWTANVTFGGPEFKTLFITSMGAVYTLEMNVKGVRY